MWRWELLYRSSLSSHSRGAADVFFSDNKERRESTSRCSEVGGLTLIDACGLENDITCIDIESHIHLERFLPRSGLCHALIWGDELLGNIDVHLDIVPDAFRHLVPTINRLAGVAIDRFEEVDPLAVIAQGCSSQFSSLGPAIVT